MAAEKRTVPFLGAWRHGPDFHIIWRMARFCFFGGYDPAYPRNAVLRKGLRALGHEVVECRAPARERAWLRWPRLALRAASALPSGPSRIVVPEFCQKDAPLAAFLGLLSGRPVVFDPLAARYETKILDRRRGTPGSLTAWWNFRIDLAAFRAAGLVLADTAAHAAYYARAYGLSAAKTAVLPVGYDDETFDPARFPRADGADRPFTVVFAGSFLPLHGVESILGAARIVERKDPSIAFVLCGSGETMPAARRLAADAGLRNCSFPGWQTVDALAASMAGASVSLGIFGRTDKARRVLPHKVYQALGLGRPVVTARTPAAQEALVHGETAWLVDEPYPESLAGAILALKADDALRRRLGANGLALARARFTPKAVASRLVEIVADRFGRIS